jgi:ketosteroid isomerase-like protein
MSQQNVERLRSVYTAWATGDFGAGAEVVHPDVVYLPRAPGEEDAVIRGRDAVAEYIAEFLQQWSEYRIVAEQFVDAGEKVLVFAQRYGKGKLSGAEVERPFFMIWTFRGDQAIRV